MLTACQGYFRSFASTGNSTGIGPSSSPVPRASTDHAASLEPKGLARLVQAIRRWEEARGTGELDGPIPAELPVLAKLRKVP